MCCNYCEGWLGAISRDHVSCLSMLHQHSQSRRDPSIPGPTLFCRCAAKHNSLRCLKLLRRWGENWDEETCSTAAEHGHLQCLKYAHQNGCKWTAETCYAAAHYKHFNCLKYARENGCPWNRRAYEAAYEAGFLRNLNVQYRYDEATCGPELRESWRRCHKYFQRYGWQTDWKFTLEKNFFDCIKYALPRVEILKMYVSVDCTDQLDVDAHVKVLMSDLSF